MNKQLAEPDAPNLTIEETAKTIVADLLPVIEERIVKPLHRLAIACLFIGMVTGAGSLLIGLMLGRSFRPALPPQPLTCFVPPDDADQAAMDSYQKCLKDGGYPLRLPPPPSAH